MLMDLKIQCEETLKIGVKKMGEKLFFLMNSKESSVGKIL